MDELWTYSIDEFLLETLSIQLVKEYTNSQMVANVLQHSIIDHCYMQAPEKVVGPLIETIGNSDQSGVRIIKNYKYIHEKPLVIRKRCYKKFDIESFLTDVLHSDIAFFEFFDFYAPMKTIQVRNNYCPYLSEKTKIEISNRNALKKATTKTGYLLLICEYRDSVRTVKKAVKNNKK